MKKRVEPGTVVWSQWLGVWSSKFEPLRLRLKFLQYVLGAECDDERKDLHIGHIMSLQTDSRAGHLMLYIQWLRRWGGFRRLGARRGFVTGGGLD